MLPGRQCHLLYGLGEGQRETPMTIGMGRNSWILGLRGVLAILFGLYALLAPGLALASLILAFGVCILLEGILSIVAAVRVHDQNQRSFPIALEGIVCVLVGLLAILRPGAAALAWLYLVSGFAVVSGVLHMAGAIQLRKQFAGEWVLILNGALTTLFGILMILLPLAGLLSLIWLIGAYSIFFGALLLAVSLRLRARWRSQTASALPA
jgi:uncharacterized membrane protein HdeD (DUF308 family)